MKKLLIDINSIIPYYTIGHVNGVGRSTMELLKALAQIPNIPFEVTLFSQNTRGVKAKKDFPFRYLHFYMPNRSFFKKVSNILHMKRWFCRYDYVHVPHNIDLIEDEHIVIYTIHDMIAWHYPDLWGVKAESPIFDKIKNSLRKCKAIVTCSEASKKDIVAFSGINAGKVTVIPWGVNREIFSPTFDKTFIKQLGIQGLYYFSASCNHPRKNLPLLLAAFRIYLNNGGKGQLVLLNPMEKKLNLYQDLIQKRQIIICRNISDKDLSILYSMAHCSLMISEYEGFGLPILESLACHTMVLSAKNSSLTEAGGNVIDYFDNLDEETISRKLLLYDRLHKTETIDIVQVETYLKKFTWEHCARSYIEFYVKLLNN